MKKFNICPLKCTRQFPISPTMLTCNIFVNYSINSSLNSVESNVRDIYLFILSIIAS